MLVILLLATLIEVTFSSNGERNEVYKVGCNTFDKVVKSAAYVDKSLLIKEFFNRRFILITAPRRFGKTINMNMIQTFCEVTVDNNGNRVAKNGSKNYKIFSENNLRIFQDKVFFNKYFGNYPTIFLDFKTLSCNNYQEFIDSFRDIIQTAYKSHKYLLNSAKLDKEEKNMFKMFYQEARIERVTNVKLKRSIATLTHLLYTHFNTESIILIDELDGPIQEAINTAESEVSQIFDFIIKFISTTLKTNKFVERGLINACVRLSGLLTTEANNIIPIPFLSNPNFTMFYGLLESEVQDLLGRLNMSEKINDVRNWYDGYRELGTNVTIYNVFGIVRYLESRKLGSYWTQSGGVKNIEWLFAHHFVLNQVEGLLEDFKKEGKGTRIQYRSEITVEDIITLRQLVNRQDEIEAIHVHLFLQYFTDQGYFNILREGNNYAYIRIPNKEIEAEIKKRITSPFFYKYKFEKNYVYFEEFAKRFEALNVCNQTYICLIKCIETVYENKSVMPYNEHAFQRDIVSSCNMSSLFEIVEVELSVNGKRIDILLTTKEKAIIIELKLGRKTAYAALEQIMDRNYPRILNGKQYKIEIFLGLHLSKKGRCTISYLVNSRDISKAHNLTSTFRPHGIYPSFPTRKKFTRRTGYTRRTRNPRKTG